MKKTVHATIFSAVCIAALSTSAFAGPSNRATEILTPGIAQKILGASVKAGPKNSEADVVKGKTWTSKANYSTTGDGPSIKLLIRHAESADQAKQIFDSNKASNKGQPVTNIGESAYRTSAPAQLNVLKGQNWVVISVGTASKPDTAAQEKLAKEILPKITF